MRNSLRSRLIPVFAGFTFVLILLMPASRIEAQSQIPASSQAYVRDVIEHTQWLVRSHLSSRERRIEERIRVIVPRDWSFTAQAQTEDGTRRIVMSAGLGWIYQQLAIAYLAEEELGMRGCFEEYLVHISSVTIDNSAAKQNRQALRPAFTPDLYAQRYGGPCSDLTTQTSIRLQQRYQQQTAAIIGVSIGFVYLHELAHHVLDHLDDHDPGFAGSRVHEREADLWAIEKMVDAGIAPAGAVSAMTFLTAVGGASLEEEVLSTHPLGMRRVFEMLDLAADLHEADGDYDLADETRETSEIFRLLIPN